MSSADLLGTVLEHMSAKIAGRDPAPNPFMTGEQWLINTDEPEPPMDPEQIEADDHQHPEDVTPGAGRRSSYGWGGHQNGRIPAKALKSIGQGSHKLEASAADAWVAMRAAAAKDGVTLTLTDSYRSYDAQVAVRKSKGHKVATATPGTSVHGWGKAVDVNVNDPKVLAWLRKNAPRFGWVNPPWAQKKGKSWEPWHWQHEGGAE